MVQSINDRGPFKIKHVYKTVAEEKDGVKKEKKVFDGYSLAIGDTRGYSAYQNGGVLTQVCCHAIEPPPPQSREAGARCVTECLPWGCWWCWLQVKRPVSFSYRTLAENLLQVRRGLGPDVSHIGPSH